MVDERVGRGYLVDRGRLVELCWVIRVVIFGYDGVLSGCALCVEWAVSMILRAGRHIDLQALRESRGHTRRKRWSSKRIDIQH